VQKPAIERSREGLYAPTLDPGCIAGNHFFDKRLGGANGHRLDFGRERHFKPGQACGVLVGEAPTCPLCHFQALAIPPESG
jgi:hypothetical protein